MFSKGGSIFRTCAASVVGSCPVTVDAAVPRGKVVADRDGVASHMVVFQQPGDPLFRSPIQFLVGVQGHNPIGGGEFQRRVAGLRKVISPSDRNASRPALPRNFASVVGGTCIYHDKFTDHATNALKTAPKGFPAVSNDHRKPQGGHLSSSRSQGTLWPAIRQ